MRSVYCGITGWQRPACMPSSVQPSCRGWHMHHRHGADSLLRQTVNVMMRFCDEVNDVVSARLILQNSISCSRTVKMNCLIKLSTTQGIDSTSSFQHSLWLRSEPVLIEKHLFTHTLFLRLLYNLFNYLYFLWSMSSVTSIFLWPSSRSLTFQFIICVYQKIAVNH